MDLLQSDYLPLVLVALVIGAILGFLLFRPRQRVRLSDSVPQRPHMMDREAAASPRTTSSAGFPAEISESGEQNDDFTRMKGVGPKFADLLRSRGYVRFEQLAGLGENELQRLDEDLGPFKGRLRRDRVPEQARFLAHNDLAGFEQEFGKLRT